MNDGMNVNLSWHMPDQCFAAVFVRDGEPWYLDGACVGMGSTRGEAVEDLIGIAEHLVVHGHNFLVPDGIPIADRRWIFAILDPGSRDDAMYSALRTVDGEPVTAENIVAWTESDADICPDCGRNRYTGAPCKNVGDILDEQRADRDVLDQHVD